MEVTEENIKELEDIKQNYPNRRTQRKRLVKEAKENLRNLRDYTKNPVSVALSQRKGESG